MLWEHSTIELPAFKLNIVKSIKVLILNTMKYKSLIINNSEDLMFGIAPKPVKTRRGLEIMGGRKIFSEKSGRIVRFLKFYPLSTKMTLWC